MSDTLPLGGFVESSYLNYAMYVIQDRALPFIGDGLKPVQRRIVYAMSELGLSATAKFKKSARTVGDVLGKYHPHGDCLSGHTRFVLADGTRRTIRELTETGVPVDVNVYCSKTEQWVRATAHSFRLARWSDTYYHVYVVGCESPIVCTGNHPFYVRGLGWVAADTLTPGQVLVSRRAGVSVSRVDRIHSQNPLPFYDFTVDGLENAEICVGASNVTVAAHNSACYEAMVLMAQPFSYRYPLVDGQGNWGSTDDPKSFAAMRYTESRLAKYASCLLGELDQGTVDYTPNFDGTLQEPVCLPAKLPNLLLNGAMGIAVGLSTDIPPHNATEVANALGWLLDHPKATLDDVMQFIKGPDFTTGAELISPVSELYKLYATGNGTFRTRCVWKKVKSNIVITELPYQISGAKVLSQIADLMRAKKLPHVEDLRDESDHQNPTRIVIVLRSDRVDAEAVMLYLCSATDLERTHRVNMNVLGLDGKPAVKPLLTILNEWLVWRRSVVKRRLTHQISMLARRIEIVQGLCIVYLNLDRVIEIIRHNDDPKPLLQAEFGLTPLQVEHVLDLRLRQLAGLEQLALESELKQKLAEHAELSQLLGSERRLTTLMKREILSDAQTYGDARRTPLREREPAGAVKTVDLTPVEPLTAVLSKLGWLRIAKGWDIDAGGLGYKPGDELLTAVRCKSNQTLVLLSTDGFSYTIDPRAVSSARGYGEPVTGKLQLQPGARAADLVVGAESQRWLVASTGGYGFVVSHGELLTARKAGKSIVKTGDGELLPLCPVAEQDEWVVVATRGGQLLTFPLADLPELPKGKGLKLISPYKDDHVVGAVTIPKNGSCVLYAGKRKYCLKWLDLQATVGLRATRGVLLEKHYRSAQSLQQG